jgi:hypothetical protein
MLEWIATENNIWNDTAANLPFRQKALAYAALPSSQQTPRRTTGQTRGRMCKDPKGSAYAVHLCDRRQRFPYRASQQGWHGCVTSETAEEDGDQDDKRRRGHFLGPDRIHQHLNEHVMKKTEQLTAIELKLGAAAPTGQSTT